MSNINDTISSVPVEGLKKMNPVTKGSKPNLKVATTIQTDLIK